MTTKLQVNRDTYKKSPRLLEKLMEQALEPGGGLYPVLEAVLQDERLRLDIREHRFNVYYAGGNLLLVDGRKRPWVFHFDAKYFKGGILMPPPLPMEYSTEDETRAWVDAFPSLIAGMEDWWTRHPKGERAHCQAMAAANSAQSGLPPTDYLVIDLEYQWAQRRFDMIAAKRRPTEDDPSGWVKPNLVFIEVKSEYGACKGKSGLGDHARDYRDIITSRGGESVRDIKREYEDVIAQKKQLGLLGKMLPFERFSEAVPDLLIVLINLNRGKLLAPLSEIKVVSEALGDAASIGIMLLNSPDYKMTDAAAVPLNQFISLRS